MGQFLPPDLTSEDIGKTFYLVKSTGDPERFYFKPDTPYIFRGKAEGPFKLLYWFEHPDGNTVGFRHTDIFARKPNQPQGEADAKTIPGLRPAKSRRKGKL